MVLHKLKTSCLLSDLKYIHPFSDVSVKLQGKSDSPKSSAGGENDRCTCVKLAGHEGLRVGGEEEDMGPENCVWMKRSE